MKIKNVTLISLPKAASIVPKPLILPKESVPTFAQFSYKAASVLPYTKIGNEDYILLGKETWGQDKNKYDGFGGKKELSEKHPLQTAARELYEETRGLLAPLGKLYSQVQTRAQYIIATNFGFILFITPFDTKELEKFVKDFYVALENENTKKNKSHTGQQKEKNGLAWAKLTDLKQAITNAKIDSKTGAPESVKVMAKVIDPIRGDHNQEIVLRPLLVKSLQPFFKGAPSIKGENGRAYFFK